MYQKSPLFRTAGLDVVLWVQRDSLKILSPHEGTGTWQDYLANRDDKKMEGPFGEKNCTEIEK